jgi:hypothetical protein
LEESIVVGWRIDIGDTPFVIDLHVEERLLMRVHDCLRPAGEGGPAKFVEDRTIEENRMSVPFADRWPHDRRTSVIRIASRSGRPAASRPAQSDDSCPREGSALRTIRGTAGSRSSSSAATTAA